MYETGKGVEQDDIEAAKWYRKAADTGCAKAQFNLGAAYFNGNGVEQDATDAVRWMQLAAMQGFTDALTALDDLQQANVISTPPPGTRIKLILLTSPKTSMYNNLVGKVVISEESVKEGKVPILLDKYPKSLAFKLKFVHRIIIK
jgi:TPR repeat protein